MSMQIWETYSAKKAPTSKLMAVVLFIMQCLWALYGFLVGDANIMNPNLLGIPFTFVIVVLTLSKSEVKQSGTQN